MQDLLRILQARQLAQDAIHSFFRSRDYLCLDTPIAVISPGTEVHLGYFATEWQDFRAQKHPLYLRSSPEIHLKQALALGLDRVYHLGKCFRNCGELADWHHPEFTMLEFYETGISLPEFMTLTADLLRFVAETLQKGGFAVQMPEATPLRLSMFEAFSQWAGIELIDGDEELARKGLARGLPSLNAGDDFETAYFKILLDVIEPHLKKAGTIFLYDYPASQCALARVVQDRAQRFELYLQGVELCNAFDELLDVSANRERIQSSNQQRERLGHGAVPEDPDFFAALTQDLKPCSGNALGFDRLLALLLGEPNLDRVIPFRWNLPWQRSVSEVQFLTAGKDRGP
jgi:lysyl-tRNA synthetase class 2